MKYESYFVKYDSFYRFGVLFNNYRKNSEFIKFTKDAILSCNVKFCVNKIYSETLTE